MAEQTPKNINRLVIHCAATPNGRWHTVEDVDLWHGQRGFKRDENLIGYNQPRLKHIGYHFVIYTSGAVVIGRGLKEVGAHARGYNTNCIGVCLIGTDKFTPQQWDSLERMVRGLREKFPAMNVIGHREINNRKKCPGFDVQQWLTSQYQPIPENILEDES